MTTVEVLKKARALIEDPDRWTKRALLKKDGRCCALGAVLVVEGVKRPTYKQAQASEAAQELARDTGWGTNTSFIAWINDNKGHAEVLLLFDCTIARLEKS